jgi:hypothetical protein
MLQGLRTLHRWRKGDASALQCLVQRTNLQAGEGATVQGASRARSSKRADNEDTSANALRR